MLFSESTFELTTYGRWQVPVRMLRGQLPAAGVLEGTGLRQYAPLAEAMRTGAVRSLNDALVADQYRFIMEVRTGVQLPLD